MLHDRLTAYLKRMTTLAMLIADAGEQDKEKLYEEFEKVKAESFEILDMRRGCVYWGPGNIELLSWLRCAGDTAMAMQLQEYMVRYINSKKEQTKPLSLDPNLKMVHDIFMHAYFVIQDSTIQGAGMGLFLQRGITLKCPFLLPYTGYVVYGNLTQEEIQMSRAFSAWQSRQIHIVAGERDQLGFMNMANEVDGNNHFVFSGGNGCIRLRPQCDGLTSNKALLELFVNYGAETYDEWIETPIACPPVDKPSARCYRRRNQEPAEVIDLSIIIDKYFSEVSVQNIVKNLELEGVASFSMQRVFEDEVSTLLLSAGSTISQLCKGILLEKPNQMTNISGEKQQRKYFQYMDCLSKVTQPKSGEVIKSAQVMKSLVDGPMHSACSELMRSIDKAVASNVPTSKPPQTGVGHCWNYFFAWGWGPTISRRHGSSTPHHQKLPYFPKHSGGVK
jgi:hypothetical protein